MDDDLVFITVVFIGWKACVA